MKVYTVFAKPMDGTAPGGEVVEVESYARDAYGPVSIHTSSWIEEVAGMGKVRVFRSKARAIDHAMSDYRTGISQSWLHSD